MPVTKELPRPAASANNATEKGRIKVLVVDYSVGFGGATKGMALMLRGMPHTTPIIATSQEPDVSRLWYGGWTTHPFRRRINYRSRWVVQEWAEKLPLPGLTSKVAGKLFAAVDLGVTFAGALQLRRLIHRHRIDILHLANGFGPPDAMLAGRMTGVPVIAHLRGFYSGNGTKERGPSPYDPALVLGASEAVIESYRRAVSHPAPSQSLYEAVEIDKFERAMARRDEIRSRFNIAKDQVAIGIFGRVVSWKGQLEFVAAMIRAMEQNEQLVGVIVGNASDGTENYFEEVQRRIQDSGLQNRFRLTGYVEEVEPYYTAMDVVVHASVEPEPFGMVVTEAMAARRPIIAANAGGPLETVRDSIDGLLVDPHDPEALAGAILELANDPERRQKMGEAGFEKVREYFDLPMVSERLSRIYQQLIAEHRQA